MDKRILVPIDLSDVELAKPAIASTLMMAKEADGVAEYVPTTCP